MYQLTNTTTILRADGASIPADPANIDYQAYQAWLAAGNTPTPAPAPSAAQIIAQFETAVQAALDAQAVAWNYESILSAASYANSTVPQFQHEAAALIAWRDQVWQACYTAEAAIQAGTQPMPASPAAFVATLPAAPARPA